MESLKSHKDLVNRKALDCLKFVTKVLRVLVPVGMVAIALGTVSSCKKTVKLRLGNIEREYLRMSTELGNAESMGIEPSTKVDLPFAVATVFEFGVSGDVDQIENLNIERALADNGHWYCVSERVKGGAMAHAENKSLSELVYGSPTTAPVSVQNIMRVSGIVTTVQKGFHHRKEVLIGQGSSGSVSVFFACLELAE